MKKEKTRWGVMIFYLASVSTMFLLYGLGLHMIDLGWNAARIDGLVDNNGIIEQTPEEIYGRGFMFISIFPVLLIMIFAGIMYEWTR